MTRIFVGDRGSAGIPEHCAERSLVESSVIKSEPKVLDDIMAEFRSQVEIPEGGSFSKLRRLILRRLAPEDRKSLSLGQIGILSECSYVAMPARPLKILTRAGWEEERVLQPSSAYGTFALKNRDGRYKYEPDPSAPGARYHPYLWFGFAFEHKNGAWSQSSPLLMCFVPLPLLLKMKKRDVPNWLHPWVNAKEVGICGGCGQYFARRRGAKFCGHQCGGKAYMRKRRRRQA
ncbi:hypothetical protein J7M28_08485 [bacterium]|nr:hypothetical protein [bacterium]